MYAIDREDARVTEQTDLGQEWLAKAKDEG